MNNKEHKDRHDQQGGSANKQAYDSPDKKTSGHGDSFSSSAAGPHENITYGKGDFEGSPDAKSGRKTEQYDNEPVEDINQNGPDKQDADTESGRGASGQNSDTSGKNDDLEQKQESESPEQEKSGDENRKSTEEYEKIIAELEESVAQTRDSMLRKAAEFDNLKRRTQKERLLVYEDAKADAVSRFLPIREDLKRSIEVLKGQKASKGILDGLQLVIDNFDKVLEHYNVEAIEEKGVPFDVEIHDAMLSQPAGDDEVESNTVIQILEPGYKMGDRVIKHAKVIVSQ